MVCLFAGLCLAVPAHEEYLKFGYTSFGLANSTVFEGADMSTISQTAHQLIRRGIVSPTTHELKINTIAFGVPAFLVFSVRM